MNWKSPWIWLAMIWMVGLAAYSNTFSAPFAFDDLVEISGNPLLQNFEFQKLVARYSTRFVTYLTFAANHALSGESTASYHVVNLLIHLLTAIVVFFLVRGLAERTKYANQETLIAGFTALLFVAHPIQTQAVTYIVQRLASLTTLLYLAGLLGYVLTRKRGGYNWLYVASWLSILLAMFSKEIAFTAPVAILMIECFFYSPPSPRPKWGEGRVRGFQNPHPNLLPMQGEGVKMWGSASVSHSNETELPPKKRGKIIRRWWLVLPYLLLLLVIPITLWISQPPLVERAHPLVENSVSQPGRPLTSETDIVSRHDYLFTQLNVVRTYVRLLVLPIQQNVDYDFPISHSLWEGKTFASLLFLVALFGFGLWLFGKNRLASFGILFFFLALLVESSVIPIRDVIFEHRLYLPSFGFFLAVVALATPLLKKRIGVITGLLIVLVLGITTFSRNAVWSSEVSLWTDVVAKSPNKARGYSNLGAAEIKNGTLESAEVHVEKALEIDPTYAEAYNNLGLLKAQTGDYKTALELFKKAVELEPLYTHAFNNLGVSYLKLGQVAEAIPELEMAVGTDDFYLDAKLNLAIAYLDAQEYDKARGQLEVVLERAPGNAKAEALLKQIP